MTATAATVTKLPTARKRKVAQPSAKTPAWLTRAYARQGMVAKMLGAVFLAGLALSLKHQAHGASLTIHCEAIEGWLLAIVIDAGFIGLELAEIFATKPARAAIHPYTRFAIPATVGASAAMNSVAFAEHASGGLEMAVAIVAGCFIPAFLYVLTKVGSALYTKRG